MKPLNSWSLVLVFAGLGCVFSARAQVELFGDSFEGTKLVGLSSAEAARFLSHATYGPTDASVSEVLATDLDTWIDNQIAIPITRQRPFLENLASQQGVDDGDRRDRWAWTAVYGQDQLRQRVAFALSQIFVISREGLGGDLVGLAEYYDLLARNAFGNYRELIEEVSLSPQMGRYLSHLRNRKANDRRGTKPDENYAREIMQLFSIGLIKLNVDHTPVLINGQTVPTYDQDVIAEMAKVFTGWTYANSQSFFQGERNYLPMVCFEDEHELGAKEILDGTIIPAGQSCEEDLEQTLDVIFAHPNVAPFISRQLIQRLVMSSPPPAYIERVASKFNDNGSGQRGDLEAVVRAILLDPLARRAPQADGLGKLREPLLKLITMQRAFSAQPAPDNQSMGLPFNSPYRQNPLAAPTVFNFYSPNYKLPGEVEAAGLFSPEFQIIDEGSIATTANDLWQKSWNSYTAQSNPPNNRPVLMVDDLLPLLSDAPALVEEMNRRLMYGTMSTGMRTALINLVESYPSNGNDHRKVLGLIHLVAISPEFAVQR